MTTDTETHEPQQLEVDIPNEKSTPLYRNWLRWDNKLFWMGISIVLYYGIIKFGQPTLVWGFMAFIALSALNFIFFWIPFFDGLKTTLSAWLFRTGTHTARKALGKTEGQSEDYERGHISVHPPPNDADRTPIPVPEIKHLWIQRRVRLSRGIGKIKFCPTDLGQDQPMGWVRRNGIWVATARTEWYPWSPADTKKQIGRLVALGRLCDMLASSDNGIIRLVLQDRTVIGEQFTPEVDFVPYVTKNVERRGSTISSNGYLPDLALQLAAAGVKHYSSMSIAVSKRKAGGKVPDGAIRDFDTFYKGASSRTLGARLAPLSHNQLVFEFMLALDPVFVGQNWRLLQEWVARKELLDPGIINPPTWDEGLKTYRFGETYHSSWIVENYGDDGKMPTDNLWRLVGIAVPKTVTTVIEITPLGVAKFFAEKSTTAVAGRNEDRAKRTRRGSEFDVVELENYLRHESALARGRGMQSRSHTYVDFTGATEDEASANAAMATNSVRHTDPPFRGILMRPLTGAQADGLGAATPLALGLKGGTFGDSLKSVMQSDSSAG
jgi:hypothetical protein